jgi:membrane fusion protein, multidrug efflux system
MSPSNEKRHQRPQVRTGPPPGPAAAPSGAAGKSAGATLWIILVLGLLVIAGVVWRLRHPPASANQRGPGGARMEMPPVPVVAGTVMEKDVPIFLEGLGTVQAFNTVTVRARVDGQVEKIAFVEGQDVHAGDLLAQIDPAPFRAILEQAVAKKGQDEAQLANAKVDLKRYADLLANEGVTQQTYDTQKALVNQLEAGLKADEAAIESAKVQLAYTTITSPIEGRTGLRQVDQGNLVHANDANGLVVITQLKPISVVFTPPAKTLGRIQAQAAGGQDLAVLAVDQDNRTVLDQGKLAVIDNQIDTTTGTIKLKATFPNTNLHLWPGQFVNARLLLAIRKNSAVVPASVIQRGPEGSVYAFVIKEDQTVEIRPVKEGQIDQGEALVEDGLRPGERVVVDGQYKLQKGSRIKLPEAGGPGRGGEGGGRPPERTRPGRKDAPSPTAQPESPAASPSNVPVAGTATLRSAGPSQGGTPDKSRP